MACLQRLQVSWSKLYCPPLDGNVLRAALGASLGAHRVPLAADIERHNQFSFWLEQSLMEDDTFDMTVKQMGASTQLFITLRLPALLIPSASPHPIQDQVW